jgi:hypothetical protein
VEAPKRGGQQVVTASAKKRKFSIPLVAGVVAAILLIAVPGGFVLREHVLPFSGTLEVRVTNATSPANPLIPGHLRILEGEQELSIPRMNVTETVLDSTWSSSRPIVFKVDTDFVREKDASFSFDPIDAGLTGSFDGSELVIFVDIDDKVIKAKLYEKKNPELELGSLEFKRGSLFDARRSCSSVQMNEYSSSLYWAARLYDEYQMAEREARLYNVTDALTYSTWASRAKVLVRSLEDLQQILDSYPVESPGPIKDAYDTSKIALDETSTSWLHFYNVARLEADDEWVQSFTRNAEAVEALRVASEAIDQVPDQLGDLCMPQFFED